MKFDILAIEKCLAIVVFVAALSFPNAALAQRQVLKTHEVIVKKGDVYQGVHFPEATRLNIVDENDSVASAIISRDFNLSGYLIKAGTYLQIWGNGVLFEIEARKRQKINGIIFGENEATIRFNQEAKLEDIYLRKPKIIGGFEFADGYHIQFFPNGKLEKGNLSRDQSFGGLNLKAKSVVQFYDTGKLKQLKLSRESRLGSFVLIGDPNFANLGETEFWPNGILKAGILAKGILIQGFLCAPGPIAFFESGKLKTFVNGQGRVISFEPYPGQKPTEKVVKPGDIVNLDESGKAIGSIEKK